MSGLRFFDAACRIFLFCSSSYYSFPSPFVHLSYYFSTIPRLLDSSNLCQNNMEDHRWWRVLWPIKKWTAKLHCLRTGKITVHVISWHWPKSKWFRAQLRSTQLIFSTSKSCFLGLVLKSGIGPTIFTALHGHQSELSRLQPIGSPRR